MKTTKQSMSMNSTASNSPKTDPSANNEPSYSEPIGTADSNKSDANSIKNMTVRELRKEGYERVKKGKLGDVGTSEIAHMNKEKLIETLKDGKIESQLQTPKPKADSKDKKDKDGSIPTEVKDAVDTLMAHLKQESAKSKQGAKNKSLVISHPMKDRIKSKLVRHKNVMLVGETGTGKTFLAEQCAKELGHGFASVSCSAGMSEAQVLGRMLMDGSYIGTEFTRIAKDGGVFLADEFDACDSNMTVVFNSYLANGILSVPNNPKEPTIERNDNAFFLACCNTFGNGAGSMDYVGRNQQDVATLDRFSNSTLVVDYDSKLERYLLTGTKGRSTSIKFDTHSGTEEDINMHCRMMFRALNKLRKNIERAKLRRHVSTRHYRQSAIDIHDGDTAFQVMKDITVSWTKQETAKCFMDDILNSLVEGTI